MAYNIYNSDGAILLTLGEGEVDNFTTSLDLVGKNVNNYGQYVNNNFVYLLTNFAAYDGNSPRSPQEGQLWYNKTTKKLNVYDGTEFNPFYGSYVSATELVTTSTGDLWFDSENDQLKLWNGSEYKLIAPAVSSTLGRFGIEPPANTSTIRIDDLETPVDVGVLYSYGNAIGFLTTVSFTMNTASSITFLGVNTATDIVNGLTVFDDADIKGDLHVRGEIYTEWKTLSINYDITYYGNFQSGSTTTNQTSINAGNIAIRDDLKKLFPVTTVSTLSQVAFNLGAEVRVLCKYNTATSVRRFILDDVLGVPNWEPYNLYYNTYTGALNNIVT
jgi:hypothetical protein